eukprot:13011192-Alexandrium_andersonii.AAC.1
MEPSPMERANTPCSTVSQGRAPVHGEHQASTSWPEGSRSEVGDGSHHSMAKISLAPKSSFSTWSTRVQASR